MNFEEILSSAWKITWKHKVLWLFSLLAIFGAVGAGSWRGILGMIGAFIALSTGNTGTSPGQNSPLRLQNLSFQFQNGFMEGTNSTLLIPILLAFTLLWLLFSVVFLLVRTAGSIGLMRGAWMIDEGQPEEKITFSGLLNQVKHYFWRVLLFAVALSVAGAVVGMVLFLLLLPVFFITMGCGLQCLMPLFIALIWFLQALVELTIVAMLGEDLEIIPAVKRAWGILTGNLGAVALMTGFLFVGQALLANLIFTPLTLLVLAPGFIGILIGTKAALTTGLLISGLGFLISIPLSLLFYSVVGTYLSTAWTLVFRRLTGRESGATTPPVEDAPQEPPLPETAAA